MNVRRARSGDAAAVAVAYNEGIEDRIATFRTETQTPDAFTERIEAGVVGVAEGETGEVLGAAW
jgi:phosphinothricin acetyltransferase